MKKEGSTASMLWLDIRRGFCSKRFWGIHQPVHEGDGIYPGGVDAKQRRPRNPNRLKVQTPINRKTALFSRTRRIT